MAPVLQGKQLLQEFICVWEYVHAHAWEKMQAKIFIIYHYPDYLKITKLLTQVYTEH